jgi:hypothetical protein
VQISLLENTSLDAVDVNCTDSNNQTTDLQTQLNSLYQTQNNSSSSSIALPTVDGTTIGLNNNGELCGIYRAGNGIKIETSYDSTIQDHLMDIYKITYGNGMFVAVGNTNYVGTIITSSDGITWTEQDSKTTKSLNNIIYERNMFVAVGDSGTTVTSPDGINWTVYNSNITKHFKSITYGKDMFVVSSSEGGIFISLNANNWIQQDSKATATLNSVTYGKDIVVVGQSGTITTSPDGINWTLVQDSKITKVLMYVTYENDIFLSVGYTGTIITSPDGINFTLKSSGTLKNLRGIISYDPSKLIAVGTKVILLCKPYKKISVIPAN